MAAPYRVKKQKYSLKLNKLKMRAKNIETSKSKQNKQNIKN